MNANNAPKTPTKTFSVNYAARAPSTPPRTFSVNYAARAPSTPPRTFPVSYNPSVTQLTPARSTYALANAAPPQPRVRIDESFLPTLSTAEKMRMDPDLLETRTLGVYNPNGSSWIEVAEGRTQHYNNQGRLVNVKQRPVKPYNWNRYKRKASRKASRKMRRQTRRR